MSRYIPELL